MVEIFKFIGIIVLGVIWTAVMLFVGVFGGIILMGAMIADGGLDCSMFDILVNHEYLRRNRSGAYIR